MKIYLAGAIRDGEHLTEDVAWREQIIDAIGLDVCILNPLGGKTYDAKTHEWDMSGIKPVASVIVPHDFWCIDRADIIIFNFRALSQKYPSIGTLIEFGRSTARPCLRYSIIDPDFTGHTQQTSMYKLHPFIEQNSAAIFPTVKDCVDFLKAHLYVLDGTTPRFAGVLGD